jgi:hypothetical protein
MQINVTRQHDRTDSVDTFLNNNASAASRRTGIDCMLHGSRIVRHAVTFGTEISYTKILGRQDQGATDGSDKKKRLSHLNLLFEPT